ncbi:hypothetical protein BACCAC_01232 [Bacteroides caccae ATCC 43185]|nr:hypothetical protein BACCAC_01232 [Bacteroides caccae ATCC 43185]
MYPVFFQQWKSVQDMSGEFILFPFLVTFPREAGMVEINRKWF